MAIYRTGKIGDGGGGGAFPADVFVVLLKPRVNYARGINERLEQRDRIEIRPARIGTIEMIEYSESFRCEIYRATWPLHGLKHRVLIRY